jgi:hypothetical protein
MFVSKISDSLVFEELFAGGVDVTLGAADFD